MDPNSIQPNNNNNRPIINTTNMTITLYFNQIIHNIRNFDQTQTKIHEIYKKINDFSVYRDEDNYSIFDLVTQNGNNILLECCIHNIKPLCLQIVNKFGNLFDLGHSNYEGETVLIYSIKHDWYYFAAYLIGYCDENPLKSIINLNIEKEDDQGKNAFDYLLEKDKQIHIQKTVFQTEAGGRYKHLFLLVEFFNYFLYKYPDLPITHKYINTICLDLPFYKKLLETYFDTNEIKFSKKFCKPPVEANFSFVQEGNPISRVLRNNNKNPPVRAQPYIPILHLPDNFDENEPDDERISLNPKNTSQPPSLTEYDPLNPGKIITYPSPNPLQTSSNPSTISSSRTSARIQKSSRTLENVDLDDDDEMNMRSTKKYKESNLGGKKRKKNKKPKKSKKTNKTNKSIKSKKTNKSNKSNKSKKYFTQ